MSEQRLQALIEHKEDKGQDVPCLIELLKSMTKFQQPLTLAPRYDGLPGMAARKLDAKLLGHIAQCYVTLLTGVTLSIEEHLTALSKLGHLYFTIYRRHNTKFVSAQHYHNLQTLVRGELFAVATCKVRKI